MKSILKPRNGMIFSGLIILLLLGLGPISGGMSGETEMFTTEDYGDIYADASTEDKETIDKILAVSEFLIGAAGVSIAVFILALAFLTEGTNQAKVAILSGGIVMLWGVLTAVAWYLQGENFIVFMAVMYAIITAPMFISGMLHLNDDGGGGSTSTEEAAESTVSEAASE